MDQGDDAIDKLRHRNQFINGKCRLCFEPKIGALSGRASERNNGFDPLM